MATVLIVEDNPMHGKLFSDALSSQGYDCIIALNGAEVTQLPPQIEPEAVLIDILLPDQDGRRLIYDMRVSPRFATTPIIAVSALGDAIMWEECMAAGANAFFHKPVSLVGLFEELKRLKVA